MPVLPEAIVEGGKYLTEENSLGHSQIKEVLKMLPDKQDSLRDVIEYRSRPFGSNAPWVKHRCSRKTFANGIVSSVDTSGCDI